MSVPQTIKRSATTALVIEPSNPIRKLIVQQLNKRGITPFEAVNTTDAIYSLRERIPESFVFSSVMGKACGFSLAKGLASIGKTSNIPIFMLLNCNKTGNKGNLDTLPNNVIHLPKESSINNLADSIEDAQVSYAVYDAVAYAGKESSSGIALPAGKQFTRLDDAFKQFEKVMKLISDNQLPGPVMPGMLMKVRQMLANSEVTMKELGDFSILHQSISVKVMSMANNVFYAPRGIKAQSLSVALGRLGLSKVSQIFHAVAALGYLAGKNPDLRCVLKNNLAKGYLVAMLGELIGGLTKCQDKDKVYTIGLFHNIGATFMYYTLSLLFDKGDIKEVDSTALATMTSNRAEELNSTVSKMLDLPKEISLLYSPFSSEFPDDEIQKMVSAVNQAIWLSDQIYENPTLPIELSEEAQMLGIDEKVIELVNSKKTDLLTLLREYLSA